MAIVSLWTGEPHRHSSETSDGVRFIRSVCDGDPLSLWPRQDQSVEELQKKLLRLSLLSLF